MRLELAAYAHFDGTNLSLDLALATDADTDEVYCGQDDPAARLIMFLRAKGIEVLDSRGTGFAAPSGPRAESQPLESAPSGPPAETAGEEQAKGHFERSLL